MTNFQQVLNGYRDYIYYTILQSLGEALLVWPIWNNVIIKLFNGINSMEFIDAFLLIIMIRVLFRDIDAYNSIKLKIATLNTQNYTNQLLYAIVLNTDKTQITPIDTDKNKEYDANQDRSNN